VTAVTRWRGGVNRHTLLPSACGAPPTHADAGWSRQARGTAGAQTCRVNYARACRSPDFCTTQEPRGRRRGCYRYDAPLRAAGTTRPGASAQPLRLQASSTSVGAARGNCSVNGAQVHGECSVRTHSRLLTARVPPARFKSEDKHCGRATRRCALCDACGWPCNFSNSQAMSPSPV
jgi:hypothetical protein